jgi:hypothetical protein
VHLAFVLGLIFLVFRTVRRCKKAHGSAPPLGCARRRAAGRLAAGHGIARAVLYIPWIFDDLAFRVGNPDRWTWPWARS